MFAAAALASLSSRPAALAKRASPDNCDVLDAEGLEVSPRVDGPSTTAGVCRSRSAAGAARPAKSHSAAAGRRRAESRRTAVPESPPQEPGFGGAGALAVENDPARPRAPRRRSIASRARRTRPRRTAAGRAGRREPRTAPRAWRAPSPPRRDRAEGRFAAAPPRSPRPTATTRPGFEAAAQDVGASARRASDLLDRDLAREDDAMSPAADAQSDAAGATGSTEWLTYSTTSDARASRRRAGAPDRTTRTPRPLQSPASPMSAAAPRGEQPVCRAPGRSARRPRPGLRRSVRAGRAQPSPEKTAASTRQRASPDRGPARRPERGTRPRERRGARARPDDLGVRAASSSRAERTSRDPRIVSRARRSRGPPGPTAGSRTSSEKTSTISSSRPSRARPARASTIASHLPSRQPPEPRVDVAPRLHDLEVRPGRQELGAPAGTRRADARARAAAPRRADADARPARRSGPLAAGTAASTSPSGRSDGTSFRLWTAKSIRPSRSASSSSRVKSPFQRDRLPRGGQPVAGRPDRRRSRPRRRGRATARRASACARESALPRAPRRSFIRPGRRGGGPPRRGRACARRRSRT